MILHYLPKQIRPMRHQRYFDIDRCSSGAASKLSEDINISYNTEVVYLGR